MHKFLKDNIVLVVGISLPAILVIVFILSSALPKYFVPDPKYDFLFSDSQYSKIEFVVINQQVFLRVSSDQIGREVIPRLYRYFAATGRTEEMAITSLDMLQHKTSRVPSNTNIVISDVSKVVSEIRGNNQPIIIHVEELSNIKIDSSLISSDEYKFNDGNEYNSSGILLFTYSAGKNVPTISKNGKNIPIIYNNSGKYYKRPIFIGWIIP